MQSSSSPSPVTPEEDRATSKSPSLQTGAQAIPQPPANKEPPTVDTQSLYAPSTTSTKTSSSFLHGSLARLPLLSRSRSSRSSNAGSNTAAGSRPSTASSGKQSLLGTIFKKKHDEQAGESRQEFQKLPNTPGTPEGKKEAAVRDPVKSVPSGKPPAVTYGDLAYRFGGPSRP